MQNHNEQMNQCQLYIANIGLLQANKIKIQAKNMTLLRGAEGKTRRERIEIKLLERKVGLKLIKKLENKL